MADETTDNDRLNDGEDVLLDQPAGNEHSAFLDDEELHEQLPTEGEGDERTVLTAAHQGARATAAPGSDTGALAAGQNAGLPDEFIGRNDPRTNSSGGAFAAAPSNDPAGNVFSGPDADLFAGDNTDAVGAGGGNARAVTGSSHQPGTDGAAATAGAGDGSATGDAASVDIPGAEGDVGEAAALDIGPPQGAGPASAEGQFANGDQAGQRPAGAGDDDKPEYDDAGGNNDEAGAGDSAGGGVNPIIGDRFDNNLVGTDGADMINAQDGDDTLWGGAGDDLMMGKKGDDQLEGGLGDDTLKGGHGDDTFIFTDADFDGNAWTDVVDGQGQNGKTKSDYDTVDLTNVTQGWTLEVDGAGAGAEATDATNPSFYTEGGAEFSGTITFDDGSTIEFQNIERIDW